MMRSTMRNHLISKEQLVVFVQLWIILKLIQCGLISVFNIMNECEWINHR